VSVALLSAWHLTYPIEERPSGVSTYVSVVFIFYMRFIMICEKRNSKRMTYLCSGMCVCIKL